MKKRFIIPVEDILEDFCISEDLPAFEKFEEIRKLKMLLNYKVALDSRFLEFWQMCVTLFRQSEFRTVDALLNAEEAYENFRKLWRTKRYEECLPDFPKMNGELPEYFVPFKQLPFNQQKFTFIVDSSSLVIFEGLVEGAIKQPEKYQVQHQDGGLYFNGIWTSKYLRAIKEAKKIDEA